MGSNFEEYRRNLSPEARERIEELTEQVRAAIRKNTMAENETSGLSDFDKVWHDDDFKDLSFKKELISAVVAFAGIVAISIIGIKLLSKR